jgi:threonine/homoserine/homoserine lactone efflux protein
MMESLGLFLLSAAGISLSGVMMPGPMTAATIAKGYREKNAGAFIAIGHGIVELPIIALVYFGLAPFLSSPGVKMGVGIAGGLMLMFMGAMIFRTTRKANGDVPVLPYNSLTTGIVMTGANPYFFLWWATVGIALIVTASGFGIYGLLLFVVVHWSCDLVWEQVVSMSVFKTRHLWNDKIRKVIFGVCSVVLVGFGVWFFVSAFS